MLRSTRLGSLFGIGIYVHWSFLLLLAFVLFATSSGGFDAAAYAVSIIVLVFGCIVLHELGHALTARHFGIATRDITLYPIGGVAGLERMSERPWEEFWIAVAGPAVNVAIAAVLAMATVLLFAASGAESASLPVFLQGNLLYDLAVINLGLAGFNMLPAFPMDGGRVLRAVLVTPLGRLRATEWAVRLGALFAIVFAAYAMRYGQPVLLLVGAFAYLAGRQELALVRRREYLRHAPPLTVLPASEAFDPQPEPPESAGPVWNEHARVWVVWRNGRPVPTYWLE
jgi:Zn-dependent protease